MTGYHLELAALVAPHLLPDDEVLVRDCTEREAFRYPAGGVVVRVYRDIRGRAAVTEAWYSRELIEKSAVQWGQLVRQDADGQFRALEESL